MPSSCTAACCCCCRATRCPARCTTHRYRARTRTAPTAAPPAAPPARCCSARCRARCPPPRCRCRSRRCHSCLHCRASSSSRQSLGQAALAAAVVAAAVAVAVRAVAGEGPRWWIDDGAALPPGVVAGDAWVWTPSPAHSDTDSSQVFIGHTLTSDGKDNITRTSVTGPVYPDGLPAGAVLVAEVFFPGSVPNELEIQWQTADGTSNHMAYWSPSGDNNSLLSPAQYIGTVPGTANQWNRLEVPVGTVTMQGAAVTGMAFLSTNLSVVWGRAGYYVGMATSQLNAITSIDSVQLTGGTLFVHGDFPDGTTVREATIVDDAFSHPIIGTCTVTNTSLITCADLPVSSQGTRIFCCGVNHTTNCPSYGCLPKCANFKYCGCDGMQCGDPDGCGGLCVVDSTCTRFPNSFCSNITNTCECAPGGCVGSGGCVGTDGCGGTCLLDGACTQFPGSFCDSGANTCGCTPTGCDGQSCGPGADGCGGTCTCTQFPTSFCNSVTNTCDCAINCDGMQCGDPDGCGGLCVVDSTCTRFPNSFCSNITNTCECAPGGCVGSGGCVGTDGCGGTCLLDGACTQFPGSFCDSGANTCGCTPTGCDGQSCGPGADGCGGTCTCTQFPTSFCNSVTNTCDVRSSSSGSISSSMSSSSYSSSASSSSAGRSSSSTSNSFRSHSSYSLSSLSSTSSSSYTSPSSTSCLSSSSAVSSLSNFVSSSSMASIGSLSSSSSRSSSSSFSSSSSAGNSNSNSTTADSASSSSSSRIPPEHSSASSSSAASPVVTHSSSSSDGLTCHSQQSITLAQLESSLDTVDVAFAFTADTVVGKVSTNCETWLDSATVSLLGKGATCSWRDSQTLTVALGTGTTLSVKSTIRVKDLVIAGCGPCDSVPFLGCTSVVSAPTDSTPCAVIVAPSVAFQCPGDVLVLDGSFSASSGGRTLKYVWGVVASGSYAIAELLPLQQLLASATAAAAAKVQVDPSLLSGDRVYTFSLTVTNFLGFTSKVANVSIILATSADMLAVTLLGNERTFTTEDRVTVNAVVTFSSCGNSSHVQSVSFKWCLTPGTCELTTRSSFTLPYLTPGTYLLNVTVISHMDTVNVIGWGSTVIVVQSSQPVALIKEGSAMASSVSQIVNLTGSVSVDSDMLATANPKDISLLSFSWTCANVTASATAPSPCHTAGGSVLNLTATADLHFPALSLAPGKLLFRLTVSKPATATPPVLAQITVTLLSADKPVPPHVQIVTTATALRKVCTSTMLVLEGSAVTWNSDSPLSFTWSCTEGGFDTTKTAALGSPISSPNLVVLANMLFPDQWYTFRLTAYEQLAKRATVVMGFSDFRFLTNKPPRSGGFTIAPSSGNAILDKFHLQVDANWLDDIADGPFSYFFAYRVPGSSMLRYLSTQSLHPAIDAIFPFNANTAATTFEVIAYILDNLGEPNTANASVVVQNVMPTAAQMQAVLQDCLLQAERTGDFSAVISVVAILAGVLNSNATVKGRSSLGPTEGRYSFTVSEAAGLRESMAGALEYTVKNQYVEHVSYEALQQFSYATEQLSFKAGEVTSVCTALTLSSMNSMLDMAIKDSGTDQLSSQQLFDTLSLQQDANLMQLKEGEDSFSDVISRTAAKVAIASTAALPCGANVVKMSAKTMTQVTSKVCDSVGFAGTIAITNVESISVKSGFLGSIDGNATAEDLSFQALVQKRSTSMLPSLCVTLFHTHLRANLQTYVCDSSECVQLGQPTHELHKYHRRGYAFFPDNFEFHFHVYA
eukprot:TRINITY_DN2198_c3_g1_i5.p1 TRINITY_DN2198_c3_g1~~TRINITY_DN2198_c3_g1_i5.p1  ORF type:complete len:1748 (-),score=253.94 TRINITY_DN2198_c3_g1_i5:42-5285(-)